MGILLLILSGLLMILSPAKVAVALRENMAIGIKILLLTVLTVIISVVIHYLFPPDFAEKHLSANKLRHLFAASVLGILTPGTVYSIYPIVRALKKKGIRNPLLVSFLTGQTIIGPARIPLEVGLLGLRFFVYRLLLSVVLGPLAGILYIVISKKLPDKE